MNNPVEEYATHDGQVVSADGHVVMIDVGNEHVPNGSAVTIGTTVGRVVEQHGNRQVEVQLLAPFEGAIGDEVTVHRHEVGVELPVAGKHVVRELRFVTQGGVSLSPAPPALAEIDPTAAVLSFDDEVIDVLAPLGAGSVNLVLDASPSTRAFEAVAKKVCNELDARIIIVGDLGVSVQGAVEIVGHDAWERLMGLRIGLAIAAHLRDQGQDVLFLGELPAVENGVLLGAPESRRRETVGSLIDVIGAALASTKSAQVTTLLRMPVSEDIDLLSESLAFGDVDVQWVINSEGCLDARRSTSTIDVSSEIRHKRAEVLSLLARADTLCDRVAIFGEDELELDEQRTLAAARQIRVEIPLED